MTPPAPPFPVPSSFPFQPSAAGSHTSILMCDSGVGFTVAATRQKAGTVSDGGAAPARPWAPGSVKGPAGTAVADVIVVSGSARLARLSHVAGAADAGAPDAETSPTLHKRTKSRRRIMSASSGSPDRTFAR